MQIHIHLDQSLQHLRDNPEFIRKIQRAFHVQLTETKRVYWKGVGWIRFNPLGPTVDQYIGHLEAS